MPKKGLIRMEFALFVLGWVGVTVVAGCIGYAINVKEKTKSEYRKIISAIQAEKDNAIKKVNEEKAEVVGRLASAIRDLKKLEEKYSKLERENAELKSTLVQVQSVTINVDDSAIIRKCPYCGSSLKTGEATCAFCGASIGPTKIVVEHVHQDAEKEIAQPFVPKQPSSIHHEEAYDIHENSWRILTDQPVSHQVANQTVDTEKKRISPIVIIIALLVLWLIAGQK